MKNTALHVKTYVIRKQDQQKRTIQQSKTTFHNKSQNFKTNRLNKYNFFLKKNKQPNSVKYLYPNKKRY